MHQPPTVGGNVNGSHAGGGGGGGGPPQLGGLFAGGMPKLKRRSGGLDTGGKNLFEIYQVRKLLGCGPRHGRNSWHFPSPLPLILMHSSRWSQKIYSLSLRVIFFSLVDGLGRKAKKDDGIYFSF